MALRILITGGARGLGLATARVLAKRGAQVVLTARDAKKGAVAAQSVRQAIGASNGNHVEVLSLDLASLASIRALGAAMREDGRPLDVILHNAGLLQPSATRRMTIDGLEETLATNALGPFLLTQELLPLLTPGTGRIIGVSSRLHLPGSRGAPVNFDFSDPQLARDYDPERAYKNSKLALLWVMFELERRLGERAHANAVCPGFVPETAAASVHGFSRFMLTLLRLAPFATSVASAAQSLAWMCTSPALDGLGGRFYADQKEMQASPDACDPDKAKRFWDLAVELTGAGR